MSMMCKISEKCSACKGPCVHESAMMVIAVMVMAGALGHWVLNWF